MSKMNLHYPFGILKGKLWLKERLGVRMAVWLPNTKSQELIRFFSVQVACNIPLKNSRRGIQLCFKPHCNRRSTQCYGPQRHESSRTPTWESQDKMSFQCGPYVERHRKYYKGEGGGLPWVQAVMNLVSLKLPMVHPSTKSAQIMH
jgi:hypothetical protein